MKSPWIVAGILASSISCNGFAAAALQKCGSSMGNVIINQVTLGCMSITGSASLSGTKFTGDLLLTGPLKADNVTFQGLNVTGPVSIQNSQVDGDSHLIGAVLVNGSSFHKKLIINATDIFINSTTTKDILIETAKPSNMLLTNSTINGNIVFKNAHGNVTNTNSTIKGKIIQP